MGDVGRILVSPRQPSPNGPLRVVAAFEASAGADTLAVIDERGDIVVRTDDTRGVGPRFWVASMDHAKPGKYKAIVSGAQGVVACAQVTVPAKPRGPRTSDWRIERRWDAATEDLYSAWVEALFDAPLDAQPSWHALHELTRDATRNLLHDHLGRREDDPSPRAPAIQPDCADLPYFLRAYFAYKVGLPFGFSSCSRGGKTSSPRCPETHTQADVTIDTERYGFSTFLQTDVANGVHSGNGRVEATRDEGDYYPVALRSESLRPGAVYADPYGHMLVIAKRVAETPSSGGILFAVDGQPDNTISRRRFWRGNFLFALGPGLGGPGFKRFRPVVGVNTPRSLKNDEITKNTSYGDYATEQYDLGVEGFYDRMEDVLSPTPRDPARALVETIQALEEQVRGRIVSVDSGEKHHAESPKTIDMPKGSSIFETTGAWEDYSTPSRDLRLLIAIDSARSFPERFAKRPERFAPTPGKSVDAMRSELDAIVTHELESRTFRYTRSDGSAWTLRLRDVVERAPALEVAYNPNDCVETRWGAPAGSEESKTCARHAPSTHESAMQKARAWFHDRQRPPRE